MSFPSPQLKTFYRCYVLPLAIQKAEAGSPREKSLKAELERRVAEVKTLRLEDACEVYIKAQADRQSAYDEMVAARKHYHDDPSKKTETAVISAEAKLSKLRASFKEMYH